MGALLGEHLSAGDLLIDLAWNIDCGEIVQWCHDRGVLCHQHVRGALGPLREGDGNKHPTERTLYWRHMNLRRHDRRMDGAGPTAVLEHGANPGLISHFTKQALLDIAGRALAEKKFSGRSGGAVAHHAEAQEFNHLAHQLGVKVIHCSERDTQITDRAQGGERVREHMERRGLPRGRDHDRRDGMGHTREGTARAGASSTPTGPRARSAWRAWA